MISFSETFHTQFTDASKSEFALIIRGAKAKLHPNIDLWLESLCVIFMIFFSTFYVS
jgi:hypothetical protein